MLKVHYLFINSKCQRKKSNPCRSWFPLPDFIIDISVPSFDFLRLTYTFTV